MLLASWLPFCCCNLQQYLATHECCGGREGNYSDWPAGLRDGAAGTQQSTAAELRGHGTAPEWPAEDGPCKCGQQKQATVGLEKVTLKLPVPTLVYAPQDWQPARWTRGIVRFSSRDDRVPVKWPTSLLSQHCALIV